MARAPKFRLSSTGKVTNPTLRAEGKVQAYTEKYAADEAPTPTAPGISSGVAKQTARATGVGEGILQGSAPAEELKGIHTELEARLDEHSRGDTTQARDTIPARAHLEAAGQAYENHVRAHGQAAATGSPEAYQEALHHLASMASHIGDALARTPAKIKRDDWAPDNLTWMDPDDPEGSPSLEKAAGVAGSRGHAVAGYQVLLKRKGIDAKVPKDDPESRKSEVSGIVDRLSGNAPILSQYEDFQNKVTKGKTGIVDPRRTPVRRSGRPYSGIGKLGLPETKPVAPRTVTDEEWQSKNVEQPLLSTSQVWTNTRPEDRGGVVRLNRDHFRATNPDKHSEAYRETDAYLRPEEYAKVREANPVGGAISKNATVPISKKRALTQQADEFLKASPKGPSEEDLKDIESGHEDTFDDFDDDEFDFSRPEESDKGMSALEAVRAAAKSSWDTGETGRMAAFTTGRGQ
ncbi:hypothetical protein UFOVP111_32 [uncultured Caudovirales phage]|uniref:Uncharacterized protein n=1 Tax=uncultured Caudovirales phage TaxID=2100421 RepID=A0A6J5L4A3_9CAUD|nr:hypothetical protein UFOVP111_32 [uncultured Caudovirales phage]